MAGYSQTPLWKKLGIKEGYRCYLYQVPINYFDLLESIPKDSEFLEVLDPSPFDLIHAFLKSKDELQSHWQHWKQNLKKEGSLWISWPKGGSAIPTDLNGNIVREFGLNGGLVDTKVCAIDNDWSGLKFMYRKKDR